MSVRDNTQDVKAQYKDDGNLSVRSNLHAKYSTKKQGFSPGFSKNMNFRKAVEYWN